MYSDSAEIEQENAIEIQELSKSIAFLVCKVAAWVLRCLKRSRVFDMSSKMEATKLRDECLENIDTETTSAVNSSKYSVEDRRSKLNLQTNVMFSDTRST